MTFEVVACEGAARRGRLRTPHGLVDTPAFMPVGTVGAVKSLTPADLAEVGTQIVLANTYHLVLRPGHRLVEALGGLHRFMAWPGPILTDSGGYQVFSLAALRQIDEQGVRFRSPLDGGAEHLLTPELTIEVQQALGADVLHPLDECLPYGASHSETRASLHRTLRWARRSLATHRAGARPGQGCFGIVQGGMYADLRREGAAAIVAAGFDGHALGGFAVGEPPGLRVELLALTAAVLPADRPRYLMGVGRPASTSSTACSRRATPARGSASPGVDWWSSGTRSTARTPDPSTTAAHATPAAPSPGHTSATSSWPGSWPSIASSPSTT